MNSQFERMKKISTLLDSQFEGPFGLKFGLDPLIGLIPVLGDGLTSLASFYLVIEAYYLGCGPAILLRMTFNILLEDLIKIIPGLGIIFDFYWKSNLKNLALIEGCVQNPRATQRSSMALLVVLSLTFFLFFALFIYASAALVIWLVKLFQNETTSYF